MLTSTVATKEPTTNYSYGAGSVRAPGTSITMVREEKEHDLDLWNLRMMPLPWLTPPDSLSKFMKCVAVMNINASGKCVKVPSTMCRTGTPAPWAQGPTARR